MRLVITGATGNVGTALLQHLRYAPEVDSIAAVATRRPEPMVAPYDRADWLTCDVADPAAVAPLTGLMRGAGAVVHLAWDIIGGHRRPAQRHTNRAGTAHVLRAATRAGVRQLVYVSSVAAYAPEPWHDVEVSEHWPRAGIPGSWYSMDKLAVERLLDRLGTTHPQLRVARLRPPAILQPAAASELTRYALGRLAPVVRHRWLRPGVLPLPGWLSGQLVHAADVADLAWRAVQAGADGAYHAAAPPVLHAPDFARALGLRWLPAPAWLVRAALEVSAGLRLQPLNSSWFDMLAQAPLISTRRAREQLGWQPAHRADDLLAAVRTAGVAGTGTAAPRLAPQPG